MSENVIDTLTVRLIGDSKHYRQTMKQASTDAQQMTRDVNGYLRDARGRFVAEQDRMIASNHRLARSYAATAKSMASSARAQLNSLTSGLGSIQGQILAAAGVGSVSGLALSSLKAASDANENAAKFTAVFGKEADRTAASVATLADEIGRSENEIRKAMSAYQSIFVGLGFGGERAADMSLQIEKLSLDFAAFHNISDEDSMQRMIAALSGSAEVLDQFGVNIRQAALEEELLAMGIKKSVHEATEAEKTMARLNVIMGVMAGQGAIGAATRESESFANQVKALTADAEKLRIELGTAMMPAAQATISWLRDMATTSTDAKDGVSNIASAFLTVADTIHTVAIGFQGLQSVITSTIAAAARGLDRLSNPMGINPNDPMGKTAGWATNIGIKSALGPLGFLLPGANETGAYADTLGAEADTQYNEYQKALMAQTPSERYAQRQAEEANKPKEEIDRDFKRMTMAESFDNLMLKAAATFGSTVADYGELFALKADNAFTGIWADATNLYNVPQQVDSFNKATAGSAVAFGSAESEITQRSKTDSDMEKTNKQIAVNTEASKRLNEKIATATEGIFQSLGAAISIPY